MYPPSLQQDRITPLQNKLSIKILNILDTSNLLKSSNFLCVASLALIASSTS
jgi:hypothetical protein